LRVSKLFYRKLTLSSPCPTLPYGRRGVFPSQEKRRGGYLYTPNRKKDRFILLSGSFEGVF
jgi:hypothetical protein